MPEELHHSTIELSFCSLSNFLAMQKNTKNDSQKRPVDIKIKTLVKHVLAVALTGQEGNYRSGSFVVG